jgi:hypothetical protein
MCLLHWQANSVRRAASDRLTLCYPYSLNYMAGGPYIPQGPVLCTTTWVNGRGSIQTGDIRPLM